MNLQTSLRYANPVTQILICAPGTLKMWSQKAGPHDAQCSVSLNKIIPLHMQHLMGKADAFCGAVFSCLEKDSIHFMLFYFMLCYFM